ncbi:MAG: AMP-binding protein, partial [Deltaproteobacteria bacterium]|nr:AMP-binding protein [Deltaproteobacteria bacterium]
MFETTALTVLEMLDRGAPDAPALLAPGRGPMTFGALRDNVRRLAERLAVLGFGRNDRIAIVMENGPDLVLALLAAASCGTAVPLNPKYRTDEFGFYFGDANAKGLIVTPGAFPDALAAVTPGMT